MLIKPMLEAIDWKEKYKNLRNKVDVEYNDIALIGKYNEEITMQILRTLIAILENRKVLSSEDINSFDLIEKQLKNRLFHDLNDKKE